MDWDQGFTQSVTTEEAGVPTMEPLTLASLRFDYVSQPLLLTSFFLIASLVMIGYHYTGKLMNYFPETCVIMVLGMAFGAVAYVIDFVEGFTLDDRIFMIYLLPPIVIDAAYQLNNNAFTSNILTILLYAVLGTLGNFFFIGSCLFGLSLLGVTGQYTFTIIDTFIFASIIVAVDPVAVIAIFKSVGVNEQLYYLVFGESLLNDAVTIVLFDLMKSFTFSATLTWQDIGLAVGAFFISSLGAAAIGFIVGLLSGVITKYTRHMREPGVVYIMAYWAYLINELFDWSGIIGLVVCCITQTQLCFLNMTEDSLITLRNGSAVSGSLVEATVFLFLGAKIVIIAEEDSWDGLVILWATLLCLIGRLISVFGLTGLANLRRHNKISMKEQFIMWWAGLRGALAFALSTMLHPQYEHRSTFISTTIAFIFVTVFTQGVSMYPLVNRMRIKMKSEPELEREDSSSGKDEGSRSKKRNPSNILTRAGSLLKNSLSNSVILDIKPSGMKDLTEYRGDSRINESCIEVHVISNGVDIIKQKSTECELTGFDKYHNTSL